MYIILSFMHVAYTTDLEACVCDNGNRIMGTDNHEYLPLYAYASNE